MDSKSHRVLVLGATGTIGQAVVQALVDKGYTVTCLLRLNANPQLDFPSTVSFKYGDVTSKSSIEKTVFDDDHFDSVISCLGSRTGAPDDAWAIDSQANINAIDVCAEKAVRQFILLSAICVQRPVLAFQHAKLAAETHLINSGMLYSIVRPTAFFKSLSGQIKRVKAGKPFLVFGNGQLTACKPISDRDLGCFIADCIGLDKRINTILPIGGPGAAITPLDQANMLSELLQQPVKIKQVPVFFMDAIIVLLSTFGLVIPRLKSKAELARIGRYYGTESMLVWNSTLKQYDEGLTPTAGSDTLYDHYAHIVRDNLTVDLGDHAVF